MLLYKPFYLLHYWATTKRALKNTRMEIEQGFLLSSKHFRRYNGSSFFQVSTIVTRADDEFVARRNIFLRRSHFLNCTGSEVLDAVFITDCSDALSSYIILLPFQDNGWHIERKSLSSKIDLEDWANKYLNEILQQCSTATICSGNAINLIYFTPAGLLFREFI